MWLANQWYIASHIPVRHRTPAYWAAGGDYAPFRRGFPSLAAGALTGFAG